MCNCSLVSIPQVQAAISFFVSLDSPFLNIWGLCVFFFFFTYNNIFEVLGASLMAQLVKNPPTIQETPVQFLGWKDLLKKG